MIFVRWAAPTRTLPTSEVNEAFASLEDQILLFAFATDRMVVGEHAGHFSVKLVTRGSEVYHFGKRSVRLQPGRLLLVNADQWYGSTIDEGRTHSVSYFVPPAHVRAMVGSLTDDPTKLLERPAGPVAAPDVPQVPFRPGRALAQALAGLMAVVQHPREPALDRLEEHVLHAGALALAEALALAPSRALSHCARRSTREELMTRVLRAREFIHDSAGRVTLAQMAHIAGLSRFHFLRTFQEVVGRTPAEYALDVRLDAGVRWLRRGAPPRRAARAAGFSSSSTFLRALRRQSDRRVPRPET